MTNKLQFVHLIWVISCRKVQIEATMYRFKNKQDINFPTVQTFLQLETHTESVLFPPSYCLCHLKRSSSVYNSQSDKKTVAPVNPAVCFPLIPTCLIIMLTRWGKVNKFYRKLNIRWPSEYCLRKIVHLASDWLILITLFFIDRDVN